MTNLFLQGTVFSFPEGLDSSAYDTYYKEWIAPYLQLAYQNNDFHFFFYISGIVFEFLQKNVKESMAVLKELDTRGQIEILNGTFYDAAPALQAKTDFSEQIETLSHYVSSHGLKAFSKGAWITPGTYEHNHISHLYNKGLKFLFVEKSYLDPISDNNEVCVAEHLGEKMKIISYDAHNAHTIDKALCDKIIRILRSNQDSMYILLTQYTRIEEPAQFFQQYKMLLETLRKEDVPPHNKLPTPALARESFHKTICRILSSPYGIDDNDSFFKYIITRQESRLLYSRFISVMKQVFAYKKDKDRKLSARVEIRKLQSHFPYWEYSDEWGIQNRQIRQYFYQKIAEIEKSITKTVTKDKKNTIIYTDFDMDGYDECLVTTPNNFSLLEQKFGSMQILQRRNKYWNYGACYVPYKRPLYYPSSFREIVITPKTDVLDMHKKILSNQYPFALVSYHNFTYNTNRSSLIYHSKDKRPLQIEKQYNFFNNHFNIHYRLSHITPTHNMNGDEKLTITLVTELNLSFSLIPKLEITIDSESFSPTDFISYTGNVISFFNYASRERFSIELTAPTHISIAPVMGVTDIEKNTQYQHHSILLYQTYTISPGNYEEIEFAINFNNMKNNK